MLIKEKVQILHETSLDSISDEDLRLLNHFKDKFIVHPNLNRKVVSFQANKDRPAFRWFKFKEAFSASLVEFLFRKYSIRSGTILDPFAGSGTALFAASDLGLKADGIEILPLCQQIIAARLCLERNFAAEDFRAIKQWISGHTWNTSKEKSPLPELRITKGAYPSETLREIQRYLAATKHENSQVQSILRFALLCILEIVSYTRKDGQYLRWDHRAGRTLPGKIVFHKNRIEDFDSAITAKLTEILDDVSYNQKLVRPNPKGDIQLWPGSCLDILPTLPEKEYDAIMTSPPYCNRYDYTRTYALELALLGINDRDIVNLRQQLLSCTVENREKDLVQMNSKWSEAVEIADNQRLLQAILSFLEDQNAQHKLNNTGIPRMVRGYFYDMACVISECSRIMKENALMFMVNDNVRYAGASISVDMILSDIAEKVDLQVENILVLPNGKGNSSQQMGAHGVEPLRKCVYVWRKK